jgi:two-component system, sporulation sensor kinase E
MRGFIERALKKVGRMNIEQVRQLLDSVAVENERLETVLDSTTDGLVVCDENNNLVLYNRWAERLLPFHSGDPSEKPIWTAVDDEEVSSFLRKSLRDQDKVFDKEFTIQRAGQQRTLSISLMPLVRDGSVRGTLVHVEDVTEKRAKESRLRRAESLASLTTLAAGVAHEIKNPLGSISIRIQLVKKAMKARKSIECEKISRNLDVVTEEIERLNRIVVDFLFAVRPMDMRLEECDLNGLIRELIDFVQYELEYAHVAIELVLSENLPRMMIDPRYIKQAVLNLIKNAMAAMPNGGALHIATDRKDDAVFLTVRDTGIGIPEENLNKIFEPYFTTKETGSGLGLTLVFKIVKEHLGEISVSSKEGQGTAFSIVLPVPQKEKRLLEYAERENEK